MDTFLLLGTIEIVVLNLYYAVIFCSGTGIMKVTSFSRDDLGWRRAIFLFVSIFDPSMSRLHPISQRKIANGNTSLEITLFLFGIVCF